MGELSWLNFIVLGVYLAMMIGVAVYTRNRSRTLNDFLLAGKGLGGWMTAFAYGTTYFSSVIFIGYAGNLGWNFGLSVIFIGIGNALLGSFLAWKVLAKRTKIMTARLGSRTMPEFFEARYNDKYIKLLSACIIFVFLIPYSASVYQGLGYLFELVFGIPFYWCIVIMAAITALYLLFGGYFATALTDFIQGLIMIVGVVVMLAFILNSDTVRFAEGLKKLTQQGVGIFPSVTSEGGFFDSNFFNLLMLVLLTSFGTWGLPQTVHKYYAIRDKKAIRQATVVSSVFALIIGVGAYLAGSFSRFYFASKPADADTIIPEMLVKVLPAGLLGLIVVLVLSASMSTLSSLSLSGSSAVSVDIYKGYVKKDASDKSVNLFMKIVCLAFIVVSVLLSVFKLSAIVSLMSLSWGTIAGCFIGPYLYGLYSKRANKYGAYASMIGGLVLTVCLTLVFGITGGGQTFGEVLSIGVSKSPIIGVSAMVLSVILTPLFSLIHKDRYYLESAQLIDKVKNTTLE